MIKYISKVLYILGDQRRKLLLILIEFAGVSFLETFGIGLIGPFVSLATGSSLIQNSVFLATLYDIFKFSSKENFIASLGFLVVGIFVLKSLLIWKAKVSIYSFSASNEVFLRTNLIRAYLEAPFSFHLGKNSAHIINNLLSETFNFCYRVLNPLLELVSNTFVVIFLVILLSWTSWFTVIVVLCIFLPLFVLFNVFKSSVARWGMESSQSRQEMVKVINHALGGIKETKVIGCANYFEEQLVAEAHRFSKAQKSFYAFNVSPRIIIEALLIVSLVGIISGLLILGKDISGLTSIVSVFAVASMRLIPSATQITNGLASLRNSSYTVNKLYTDLKELEKVESNANPSGVLIASPGHLSQNDKTRFQLPKLTFKDTISIKKLNYVYPESESLALHDLSIDISKGQSIALIGKSGAGKTTLVDVILGLLIPNAGDIQIDGQSIYSNLRSWQNLVGYIPQSIFLIEDTIQRNIAFGVPDELIDPWRLQQAIETAQLTKLIEELPHGLQTIVGERGARLSGGQRQRVGIARALYHEREILVLDEATSALDNETEALVTQSLQTLCGKKTMIIIAHRLTTVENCDLIYVMERGKVTRSGTYKEVVLSNLKDSHPV